MQETEHEFKGTPVPAHPQNQPLPLAPLVQGNANDDDPDVIFAKAVAEIDTQPFPIRKRTARVIVADTLKIGFLVLVVSFGLLGMIWQALTYPHTLVVLFTKATPASITTTLAVPTRTLAPVTLTRSFTTLTTGHGHQDARAAAGTLTLYNGLFTTQTVPIGTVFTGQDGVQVSTDQSVTIPAANPPQEGEVTITATPLRAGSHGNIHSYDINTAFSSSVFVKNLQSFTGGRDARDYKAVAPQDLQIVSRTVNETLTQAFTTAFSLRQREAVLPTTCHTIRTANHQIGEEAQSVTLTVSKTCSALAYSQDELAREATATFTHTKPAAPYHLVGSVQTTVQSVTPLSVAMSGKWAYTFSPDYEQLLAQQIQGDTPAKARKVLLQTGVLSDASVPNTLPPSTYITFLVLVG